MPFDDEKKIKRLKEKESKLVSKGYKAVDEGRDKKADRILGRAANLENRIITLEEKNNMPMKNAAIDKFTQIKENQIDTRDNKKYEKAKKKVSNQLEKEFN
jgi:phage shock protein A